ncbi:hypothetical protein EEB18_019230 [Sphingopyxis sp. OPL5]|uniref:hypothetical protein n=1 Tax=Sphingopyxis sp. OPL5 TaxID=2486273 RepID=UPI00164E4CF4|nr:hypothetical protein [Sphingopyxis sp. OPL5]QNO26829.1 hypothetical protein EEB18_019230 [Sphingopyxis sp. OPL5]
MTDFSDDARLHGLWQGGDAALAPLPLDEIKRRAARFGDIVRRRNRREYIAAAIVLAGFSLYAIILPGALLKIGSLLVIAGVLVVVWQLARRTSRPDPDAEAADVRAFYRARLVREEHMLARVGLWYLAPLLPGLLTFMAGEAILLGRTDALGLTLFLVLPLLLFAGIWLLNHRAAAMLRARIDRIDRAATPGDSE